MRSKEYTEDTQMKKSLTSSGVGALIIVVAAGLVQAQTAAKSKSTKSVIYVPADQAQFKQAPTGRVSMASLFLVTRTRVFMERSRNSSRGTTRECTFTPMTSGSSLSKEHICIKMKLAKSVWGREISFEFLAATNIGAAETRRKARSFTRKHQVSST